MKILLAIDDSKFSTAATDAVVAQAKLGDAEVKVLHVIEPMPMYLDGRAWYGATSIPVSEQERKIAQELVAQHSGKLREVGIKVTTVVKEGIPKVAILETATEWPADLVVVGSHGRAGLSRFFIGSVSEAVARHAPCSVQVVRALSS